MVDGLRPRRAAIFDQVEHLALGQGHPGVPAQAA